MGGLLHQSHKITYLDDSLEFLIRNFLELKQASAADSGKGTLCLYKKSHVQLEFFME